MKLFKLVFVCLAIFISNAPFVQAQETEEESADCSGSPELFIIEVTDQRVVHYLWSFEGTANFYILEYIGLDGCITLNFSDVPDGVPMSTDEESSDISNSEIGCPPDVWTEIPGPTLKTSSSYFENKNEHATAFFKPCVHFEFRMKVVCGSDTLYSNIVPYFYEEGNCSDCIQERTLTKNHHSDTIIQANKRISSNVVVGANVTYKAGERIELTTGFSSNPAINFKVMTESCAEP